MFFVDQLLLIAGLLLVVGIVSSKLSNRVGLPVLVLFLVVGMLAGSEGIGGIAFDNYELAHGVGTIALALILFDGGLRTPFRDFGLAWKPALTLATGGVLLTAVITGVAVSLLLDLPLLYGVLLGSIVGSTDAPAVFTVLRGQGLRLQERLRATLEIESGSNDPMAVFLTIGLIEVILGQMGLGFGLLWFFVVQMSIGAVAGVVVGRGGAYLVNRINLDAAGLYPVLTSAAALLAYGAAAALGGSGFLSAYLAGMLIGNSKIVFRRGIFLFHDGGAWIAQILMFVLLGLLIFPSAVLSVAWEGLLIALVLTFVARPVAVFATLLPFRFSLRELIFLSWVGLKGAVPIILAIYPLLFGIPEGQDFFDVIFFVVLFSALTQGWSLPLVARSLKLQQAELPEPAVTLEITSLKHVDGDIVEYAVDERSRAADRRLSELALPEGVVVAMIAREHRIVAPGGATVLRPGDYVFVVLQPEVRALVDRVFAGAVEREAEADLPMLVEFLLRGTTTVDDLREFYGVELDADPEKTLGQILTERLGDDVRTGTGEDVDGVRLVVRGVVDGAVTRVGLAIRDVPDEIPEASPTDTPKHSRLPGSTDERE